MQDLKSERQKMQLLHTYNGQALTVPDMMQIRPAAKATGLPEHLLRTLVKENRIIHIKVGQKVLINIPKLIDYLNVGDSSMKDGETA